jgi:hypothetical protein
MGKKLKKAKRDFECEACGAPIKAGKDHGERRHHTARGGVQLGTGLSVADEYTTIVLCPTCNIDQP